MTIHGWLVFGGVCLFVGAMATTVFVRLDSIMAHIITVAVAIVLCVVILLGMLWFFNSTATGQRALVDQKSELENGLNRTITVYTANGEVIAQYTGKIDIEGNDGGYVIFDFEGKRYMYYNCFIECIADIG